MKNILLTFILLLTVSFAFAGNETEKISVVDVEESLEINNKVKIANADFTNISLDLASESINSFILVETPELNSMMLRYFCAVEDGHYRGEGSGRSPGQACRRARRDLRRQKR